MPAVTAAQPQEAVREDAALEEGVELVLDELRQVGGLLNSTHRARAEFLESSHIADATGGGLQSIINDEAARMGKSAIASQFGALVRRWGKGGGYDICLGDPVDNTRCGQAVIVRSNACLLQLPIKVGPYLFSRHYSHASLISDLDKRGYDPSNNPDLNAFWDADVLLLRGAIRDALLTW